MKKRNRIYSPTIYEKVNSENKLILEDYILEMKSNGKSEKTIYQYVADIKMYFCWVYTNLDNKRILDLKKRDFRRFFLELQNNGASAARINRVQCSIRTLLEFASNDDDEYSDYEINAMKSIKGLSKETVRDIIFLTDDQVNILIDYLMKKKKYQQALYISLSYDSAGRRNEVAQVLKTGFLDSKMTNTVQGKRGKKFQLIYFNRTREIAKLYLEQRGEDDIESLWVSGTGDEKRAAKYETLYNWTLTFRRILERETGEEIQLNPHSFRHSSLENYSNGTHHTLKELGKTELPLEVLKVLAHHESIDTTQSYLKNKDEELLINAFGL